MKLLCLTDLHSNREALERILDRAGPVDLVLLGGDITNFGSAEHAERFVRHIQDAGREVLAVAGNCDCAAIDHRLAELGVSLHARGVVRDGVGLHGISGIPPWRSRMYSFDEVQLAEALRQGFEQIAGARRHVVLAHVPPHHGRLDRTFLLQHAGSKALREFVDDRQPDLVLCGHIHEARGTETLGQTTVVNSGPASGGYYAVAMIGEQVEVELRQA